jgi:hypothetical protein
MKAMRLSMKPRTDYYNNTDYQMDAVHVSVATVVNQYLCYPRFQ